MRQLMKIKLDYTKTQTISCQLESVFAYLFNYNDSFTDKDPKEVLWQNISPQNYNNDLAFGCFSVGLDFDFKNNYNVRLMEGYRQEIEKLTLKKTMYLKNLELYD